MNKPKENFKEESKKGGLRKSLITILIREHRNRREFMFETMKSIKQRIEDSDDEMDTSMNIDYLNDVVKSSIKNDENIVDLIELLLKYNYNDDEVEEIEDYKNELSSNELDINFDE